MANRAAGARGALPGLALQPSRARRAAARLGLLVAFEVAAIVVLHRLGADPAARVPWHDLGRWVAETRPEDAVWAVVRLIGLACAYWQLASTLVYLGACLSGVPRLVAGVRWACLPGVRRLVDGAVALSIVGGAVLSAAPARATTPTTVAPVVVQVGGPQVAAPGPSHAYRPVAAGDVAAGPSASTTSTTATATITAPTTTSAVPGARSNQPPSPGEALAPPLPPGRALPPDGRDSHDVVPGDNLWDIAATHLAQARGRPIDALSEAEVSAYWLRLMAANHGRLRSGNPNLIFAGERVICPPVDAGQQ